ncbi:domain found in Dishevelled, Egl-10, and Pleckstrin [Ancylostoma ceylanicum]|uniref:Domain found in Dishevelled, Egl-10, and Pleckstrin n=1 Tax=Ancylostoma ceylanicum TaxID=53326 RepID=A0A0D6LWD2_9BILA|nr:domain found in Dishevelled, Egl-10, and Pleckstrin [Ancylostoma ceylanicum]
MSCTIPLAKVSGFLELDVVSELFQLNRFELLDKLEQLRLENCSVCPSAIQNPGKIGKKSILTCEQLDTLSRRLQESVQLRTHKYFRVAVPQALTGQSLVALVGEKGYAEDEAEAVHLATLLLQHGYLFPVIEPALTVRDDGTLYRLQRPYFWPSHATQTDNVEYDPGLLNNLALI